MNEVHSEFLLNMFEDYKEDNKKIIENLLDENTVRIVFLIQKFKSELRFARLLLEMIKKRLDEILLSSKLREKNTVAVPGKLEL